MVPPSLDIYHWTPPPPNTLLPTNIPHSTRRNLRGHWMESFSFHMTLSPRCVFHGCWATHSTHRAPLFPQHRDTKATFEACAAKRRQWNTRHNKRSCCVCVCVCVCDEWPDREPRHWPLVTEPQGQDKAAQLCPIDAPSPFFFLSFFFLHCMYRL